MQTMAQIMYDIRMPCGTVIRGTGIKRGREKLRAPDGKKPRMRHAAAKRQVSTTKAANFVFVMLMYVSGPIRSGNSVKIRNA